jgi:3-hydroxyacyl-CoA dehydrogenase
MRRLSTADELGGLAGCPLVLESIIEAREAKRPLLAQLDRLLPAAATLASNTSTIRLADLGEELTRPERFAGLHFCHPVRRRATVELAATARTDPAILDRLAAHVQSLGHRPIRVADSPGFVVNRVLFPVLSAALAVALDGVEPAVVDRAARAVGLEKGPLELLDEIGLDVALRCGWELSAAMPDRVTASPLLVGLVKRKQLGTKTGAGIFVYPADSARLSVNPILVELVAKWGRPCSESDSPDDARIAQRLLDPLRAELRQVLAEGIVDSPETANAAVVHGLGIPAKVLRA